MATRNSVSIVMATGRRHQKRTGLRSTNGMMTSRPKKTSSA